MPWFYIDDGFSNSKPVMNLDARIRNEAIGLWVRCGAWSAKEETDGHVPMDVVKQFNGRPAIIRALREDAQLWAGISEESRKNQREILFNSWEKWQKTRAENVARRKREAEKKSTWRSGKKGRDFVATSDDSEMSTGDNVVDNTPGGEFVSTGESTGVSRYPDPTRPDPTLIPLEISSGGVTSVDAREATRPQCIRHPHENAKTRCADCKARREWDEAEAARAKADEIAERRRRREAIDACDLCDQNGKVETSPNSLKTCTHPNAQEAANA